MPRDPTVRGASADAGGQPSQLGTAGAARLTGQVAQMAISIVSLAILARLLVPADFGLFALGGVWLGFLGVVRDFGLPLAAVHHRHLDGPLLAALARHNLRLQAGLLAVSALAGPLFAALYGDPRLRGVVWGLSAATVLLGAAAPARAWLLRGARFATLATVEGAAAAVGAVAAVVSAWAGAGYWALVIFHGARCVAAAGLLAGAAAPWPRVEPGAATRAVLPPAIRAYGRRTTWARFVGFLGRHLDRALLGFHIPAAGLGFYQQARRWSTLPSQGLQAPLLEVVVSLLSRRRDDPHAFRAGFIAAARASFCLAPATLVFLALEAPTAVAVLLGDGWEPVVPLLRWLALAGVLAAPLALVKWLFQSLGRTRRQLRWATAVSLTQVVAVAVAAPWGAEPVALALALAAALQAPASIAYACGGGEDCAEGDDAGPTPVRPRDFAAAAAAPALATLLAGGAVWLASTPLAGVEEMVAASAGDLAGAAARGVLAAALFATSMAAGLTLAGWSPRRLVADLTAPSVPAGSDPRQID